MQPVWHGLSTNPVDYQYDSAQVNQFIHLFVHDNKLIFFDPFFFGSSSCSQSSAACANHLKTELHIYPASA